MVSKHICKHSFGQISLLKLFGSFFMSFTDLPNRPTPPASGGLEGWPLSSLKDGVLRRRPVLDHRRGIGDGEWRGPRHGYVSPACEVPFLEMLLSVSQLVCACNPQSAPVASMKTGSAKTTSKKTKHCDCRNLSNFAIWCSFSNIFGTYWVRDYLTECPEFYRCWYVFCAI